MRVPRSGDRGTTPSVLKFVLWRSEAVERGDNLVFDGLGGPSYLRALCVGGVT